MALSPFSRRVRRIEGGRETDAGISDPILAQTRDLKQRSGHTFRLTQGSDRRARRRRVLGWQDLGEEKSRHGKRLAFVPEELQDLAESKNRAFALLSTLYPFVDTQHNQFHIDHIFFKSRFTWGYLRDAGVPEDDIPQFQDRADRLPNLQLLAGRPNQGGERNASQGMA